MKTLKRHIFVIIIAVAAMLLCGCAGLYDMLNFSAEKLPSVPTLPDSTPNPYQPVENAVSKAEFEQLIADTLTAKNNTYDEAINFMWNNMANYNGNDTYSVYRENKYIATAKAAGNAYASVVETGLSKTTFYDKYYVNESNKYVIGEFFDYFTTDSYEILKSGSVINNFFDLFADSFVSVDMDYLNGKESYYINLDANPAEIMAACNFDFSVIGQDADSFVSAAIQYALDENDLICSISLTLEFENETFRMMAQELSMGLSEIATQNFNYELSAVESYINNFYNNLDQVKAEITTYDKSYEYIASLEEVKVFYHYPEEIIENTGTQTLKQIVFDGNTYYYNSNSYFVKNGDTAVETPYSELGEVANYFYMPISIYNVLDVDYIEDDGTLTLKVLTNYNEHFYGYDASIYYDYMTFEFDSETHEMLSYTYYSVTENYEASYSDNPQGYEIGELLSQDTQIHIVVEFDNDFEVTFPDEVYEIHYYYE